jgi:hypothetical protein
MPERQDDSDAARTGGASGSPTGEGDRWRESLSAFLDGELDPAEAEAVARALESDERSRALVDGWRAVDRRIDRWIARSAPGTEAAGATAAAVRRRLRRRRILARAGAAAAAALAIAALVLAWPSRSTSDPRDPWVLTNLDVLEAMEAEGGDPELWSAELVDWVLEEVDLRDGAEANGGLALGTDVLDAEIFDYVLEDELAEENL